MAREMRISHSSIQDRPNPAGQMADVPTPGGAPTTSPEEKDPITVDKRQPHDTLAAPSTSEAHGTKKLRDGALDDEKPIKKRRLHDDKKRKKRRLRPADPLAVTLDPATTPHCPPHPVLLGTLCLTCFRRVVVNEAPEEDDATNINGAKGGGGGGEKGVVIGASTSRPSSLQPPPAFLSLNYIEKGMRISTKILEDVVRPEALEESHRRRKLVLIVDLDHTLIHTTTPPPQDVRDPRVRLFKNGSHLLAMAVRPWAPAFLERARAMYDIYAYTLGGSGYARKVVAYLDPDERYFHGSNVISNKDSTRKGRKGLDVVLAHPSTIVILDDTKEVWRRHEGNLVRCKKYVYPGFGDCSDDDGGGGAPSSCGGGGEKKEDSYDRTLFVMSDVLDRIHMEFFEGGKRKDVTWVLKRIRERVLNGCRVAFGAGMDAEETRQVGKVARHMGAEMVGTAEEATHVVAGRWTEAEEMAAAGGGKFVVRAEWVWSACWYWERPAEKDFLLLSR